MTDSADILKEYLVSIGVKADVGMLSKFAGIIGSIEKMTIGLTAALTAGIGAIEGLVYVTTNELDDLYWATKRLKSSASDIKDFQLDMQKAGGDAAEAMNALETLNQFRRTNPAANGFLGLMGINAQGKGDVQVLDQLAVRFKQLKANGQEWLAFNYGERLGLDFKTVNDLMNKNTQQGHVNADMYKKLGINQEDAMKKAHDYQNQLKDLHAEFTVASQALGLKFLPVANQFLQWLTKSQAAKDIGDMLLTIATNLGTIADESAKLLAALPPEAQEFGLIGLFLFGKRAAIVLTALGVVDSLLTKLGGGEQAKQQRITDMAANANKNGATIASLWNGAKNFFGSLGKNAAIDFVLKHEDSTLSGKVTKDSGGITKYGISSKANPGVDVANLSLEQARAIYDNKYYKPLSAMPEFKKLSLRMQEEVLDAAVNQGLGNATKWLKQSGGSISAFDKLRAEQYNSLASKNPGKYGKDLKGWMSRLATSAPLGSTGGGKNVTINQNNTTTIHGAKDAQGTADKVERVNDRTNGDLIRNLSPQLI